MNQYFSFITIKNFDLTKWELVREKKTENPKLNTIH